MRTADFDYDLPEASIAQRPVARGDSRLLVLDSEADRHHHRVADLPELLRAGDLLVVNDTRVIPARLFGRRRPGGGRTELLLTSRLGVRTWQALVRPGRKCLPGTILDLASDDGSVELTATITDKTVDGRFEVEFSTALEPILDRLGHVPLPPYIRRGDEAEDQATYQTVYARHPGAVAAPTAGLHFDQALLDRLEQASIERAAVTLHVGIGTFKPVSADDIADHRMAEERYDVPAATARAIERTRRNGGRIVAVGTTVVRTLESAAHDDGSVAPGPGASRLFITPGYDFRVTDVLMTNFHLPRSTLLMLVSALGGRDRVLDAYREAIDRGYRFYSYGDAMLVEKTTP